MTTLVAVASRHGSTSEIAAVIADELRANGQVVELWDVTAVDNLDSYDTVVLGSAIYTGNWLPEAKAFVNQHRAALANKPVWMFSSGPIGTPPLPAGDPAGVAALIEGIDPHEHVVFAGKLDPHDLGFVERAITKVLHAPSGDYRDWTAIREWAQKISAEERP